MRLPVTVGFETLLELHVIGDRLHAADGARHPQLRTCVAIRRARPAAAPGLERVLVKCALPYRTRLAGGAPYIRRRGL